MRLAITTVWTMLMLSACGGDGSGLGVEATRLAFTVQPGSSTVAHAIAPSVQVAVLDASGSIVGSAENPVTLALGLNPSGAALSGAITVNASGGVATFSDLQISRAGTGYTLTASSPDLAAATSAVFDVSPAPGVAVAIAPTAGENQTAAVGHSVGTSPAVKVTDGFGDLVPNVSVTFSIGSGGGSITGGDQVTDGTGVATVGRWTLGIIAGAHKLMATAPGLEGSPVTFTATATPGAAAMLTKQAGDDQTAAVGHAVSQPPAVLVTDSYGNAVADAPVEFTATSGGGSLTGGSQTTGSNGIASVGSWTLGTHLGSNTLRATSAGLAGSPLTFTATATTAVVEVRNNVFISLQNGSGNGGGFLENYATDTIPVGGTLTWVWVGQDHNVSIAFSGQNLSGTHSAPYTYSRTFTSVGTFFYRCTNHSEVISYPIIRGMVGRVEVR